MISLLHHLVMFWVPTVNNVVLLLNSNVPFEQDSTVLSVSERGLGVIVEIEKARRNPIYLMWSAKGTLLINGSLFFFSSDKHLRFSRSHSQVATPDPLRSRKSK